MKISEFRSILLSAPQSAHFSDQAITNLYNYLDRIGEDHEFHAQRVLGVGGSEVGAIIEWFCETPNPQAFQDAADIAAQKLLTRFPSESNTYTERGSELEVLVQDAFQQRYRVTTDEETLKKVRKHKYLPIGCNLDDLVNIKGKRIIPDYKTSVGGYSYQAGAEVASGEELPLPYIAQLHSYVAGCRSHNIEIDQIINVGLHCDEELFFGLRDVVAERESKPEQYKQWVDILAKNSIRGAALTIYPIAIDNDFIDLIEEVVPKFFNERILTGIGVEKKQKAELTQDQELQLTKEVQQSEVALSAQKAAERLIQESKARIEQLTDGVRIESGQVKSDFASLNTRKSFDKKKAYSIAMASGDAHEDLIEPTDKIDIAKLVRAFEALGGDASDPSLKATQLSITRLKDAMLHHGIDAGEYTSETVSVSLTQKKKGPQAEQKQEMIDSWADEFLGVVRSSDSAASPTNENKPSNAMKN